MIRLAIVGTCGKYPPDKKRLRAEHMDWMVDNVRLYIEHVVGAPPKRIILVSGGSAWAEHTAVRLYLTNEFAGLELYLPSKFDTKQKKYINTHEGRTFNALHAECRDKTGADVFGELARSIDGKNRATVTVQRGYKPRNTLIARGCDHLVAFTFGGSEPIKGGAMDVWEKMKSDNKIHFDLFDAPE